MGFYDEYKPFRNYMRRFERVGSLVDVWCLALHIMNDRALPPDYLVGKPFGVYHKDNLWPWDLDILAREIVLNASNRRDRTLRRWNDLAAAVNHIRRLDGVGYTAAGEKADVLFELHRIAHRQFPWQVRVHVNSMMRVYKVFGRAAVDAIVMRELGMSMDQFFNLGHALTGFFQRKWGLSTNTDYSSVLNIPLDASQALFRRITVPIETLRSVTAEQQSYGPDWLYAWNPLEATPLVGIDPANPDRVICPIPYFLQRRMSAGIFYDLVKSTDFDNPYGDSFQQYVGEVLSAVCKPPRFTVLAEKPYFVGTDKHHGVDWVVSDPTGHLFIEAKTKRLTLGARIKSNDAAVEKDLVTMGTAIVQHYRNIRDALDGKTQWVPDGKPLYPLILTLEEWYIFSPRITEMLNQHVHRLLAEEGISEDVLLKMPFTVCSAHEFEVGSQIMAQVGIHEVISQKTETGSWNWSLLPFLTDRFKAEMKNVNYGLFVEDFKKLLPDRPVGK